MNWKKTLSENSKYIVGGTLLLASILCLSVPRKANPTLEKEKIPALISNTETGVHAYLLIPAKTPAERATGLMFVGTMPENEGMLFIFPEEGIHTFWMYNTFIPLDIIFISSDNKVVHIAKNVQPHDIKSIVGAKISSKYAIELNAGTSDKLGINLETVIIFDAD